MKRLLVPLGRSNKRMKKKNELEAIEGHLVNTIAKKPTTSLLSIYHNQP